MNGCQINITQAIYNKVLFLSFIYRHHVGGRRFMRNSGDRPDMYATYEPQGQAKIVRPGDHGYTHVWELRSQEKSTTDPRTGDPNMQKLSMYHDRAQQMKSMQQTATANQKEHIYESPKFERSGRIQEGGVGPFCHEFDRSGHEVHNQRLSGRFEDLDCPSEDTEDELENCDMRFSKGRSYRPVPPGIPLVGMVELSAKRRSQQDKIMI